MGRISNVRGVAILFVQVCILLSSQAQSSGKKGTVSVVFEQKPVTEVICSQRKALTEAELENMIATWIKTGNECAVGKPCLNSKNVADYNSLRAKCASPARRAKEERRILVDNVEAGLQAMKDQFTPLKDSLDSLDREYERQFQRVWGDIEKLHATLAYTSLGAGRIQQALYHQSSQGRPIGDLIQQLGPTNAEELLAFAWNFPWPNQQPEVYDKVEAVIKSSQDPVLQTVLAIDIINTKNPKLEAKAQQATEYLSQLQSSVMAGDFRTIASLATRFPKHYAYLRQSLFQPAAGSKASAAALWNLSELPDHLPTVEERLQTIEAIVQPLLGDSGTLVDDAEYFWPLTKLADELNRVPESEDQKAVLERLRNKFATHVNPKSLDYYQKLYSQIQSLKPASGSTL
ncbi:uncharacterized protein LOC126568929 [Anopheles aquasalis]|uniref:uncharacterized protein LOC126568929 n=1 Tax=Anopheles aquasalis TaxID=42839 RepID=UPI00215A5EF1|nr:uncharacterized protein LOC126568929 [Anopheles aquasalis]